MVSARAGVRPRYAIRRTAAAAPVTTFTPGIPSIPSPFAGSSTLEPGYRLIPSQSPSAPYSARKHVGTPGTKTKRKLFTCGIRATLLIQNRIRGRSGLEDERGTPLKSGQNRHRRVEKRPVPEIAMGARHDHGPRRLRYGENPDQPAALLE